MYEQEEIKQRQVEGLIGGTIGAYNGLLLLDGDNFSRSYQAGNFTGVSKVTVNNAGKLDKIVDNLIGMTLHTFIPSRNVHVHSDIFNENTSIADIDAFKSTYDAEMVDAETYVMNDIANEKTEKTAMVNDFKNAMTELKESYKTNDVQAIADAIEKVSDIATWGIAVKVKPLYDAAGAMKRMANFNVYHGFDDARGIQGLLSNTMNGAQVKETHTFLGVPYKIMAPPNKSQIYRGSLDHEFIAQDLMRQK